MIIPNDKQKAAIPHIKWLYSPYGNNGEGRTMAVAMAIVELALEFPNNKIYYQDFIGPVERNHFRENLWLLIRENYKDKISNFELQQKYIRFFWR